MPAEQATRDYRRAGGIFVAYKGVLRGVAGIVVACAVMACIVTHGLYTYGLYTYGLFIYGLYCSAYSSAHRYG